MKWRKKMIEKRLNSSPIVYYTDSCDCGEWVLFLHAAFVNHEMFNKQFEYFKGRVNILAIDIIGHGKSTDAGKGDSIERMSEWISSILRAEKIKKLHIVGVSLGSVLAQDFANKYPEAVASLACFGGYDINNFDSKMQRGNGLAQLKMIIRGLISVKWFAKDNKRISAYTQAAQEDFYEMNIKFQKRSFMYLSSLGSMVNNYKTEARDYPLLIGCGEHDIPMEHEAVEQWAQSEPSAETVVFKGAGHCVNMDKPEEFNQYMEGFWKTV